MTLDKIMSRYPLRYVAAMLLIGNFTYPLLFHPAPSFDQAIERTYFQFLALLLVWVVTRFFKESTHV